ncbi:hypothetical protein FGIG_10243 [Fasciola gigantica]|uniref:Uncharacterized protein n=1 Tax=Fasciola gigantica TaxID=46835 RepID=A0A504Z6W1_FASGI|nr:hypothetical protein FGIG_10243 [Fasciola gigantica]
MCIPVIKISTEWPLLAFLTLTWISSSYNVNVLITLETRRSPHQNWTLHRDRPSVWKFSPGIHNVTPSRGLDQNGQNAHSRASWELLDEPQRQNGGFRGQSYTSRPDLQRIPYLPYDVTQQQIGRRAASSKHVPGSPVYNSIPPWYADKYRRMPRDESDDSLSGTNRFPWNYQPKCRSCGRPMLQDSFCSDDFGTKQEALNRPPIIVPSFAANLRES